MLFDSHAHIDAEQFQNDTVQAIIDRARENGVGWIMNAGDRLESSQRSVELAMQYDAIYALVGIHPEEAAAVPDSVYEQLADWTLIDKVAGIGEIGLDYYWKNVPKDIQRTVFIRQLDVARQMHQAVCVHDREAHGDMLDILKREGRGIRGVMHCYSGSLEMAKELLKLGWYLGVDGPLTFKNAAKLPEIMAYVPLDRILVETDSPYMAPVPQRGKRNEPAYVRHIAEKLAQLKNISYEEVACQTTQNVCDLYGIKI